MHLPRDLLPGVLSGFAAALAPGGHLLLGTHAGAGDIDRSSAYGNIPVQWTHHLWQPDQLAAMLTAAGLQPIAELRLPKRPPLRAGIILTGRKP